MIGKTTTTSLIYEILKQGNKKCFLGGNIGIPLFTKIKEMDEDTYTVLELSSFQLMTMKKCTQIAVITNITPNHLDIHKSYEEYIEAKINIFRNQQENDLLVLNYDNEITQSFILDAKAKVKLFSSKEIIDDGYIYKDGHIKKCCNREEINLIDVKDIKLRGVHNYENICTALCATDELVSKEAQIKTITNFSGVEHRLEFVREINGAKWYNDSIGSSPTRTISGLKSFDEDIVLIAGGYDKHLDYTPLAKPVLEKVTNLILLGQTADKIKNAVEKELNTDKNITDTKNNVGVDVLGDPNKSINIFKVETLEQAVQKAKEVSNEGDVVLFSPASASFDMFKNFMERGKKFKELVNKLLV